MVHLPMSYRLEKTQKHPNNMGSCHSLDRPPEPDDDPTVKDTTYFEFRAWTISLKLSTCLHIQDQKVLRKLLGRGEIPMISPSTDSCM